MSEPQETAALALAESRPKNKHGQLCPVWVHRLNKVRHAVTIAACDCWILADARLDAAVVLAAVAAPPQPSAGLRGHEALRAVVEHFGHEYDVDGRQEWHSLNCVYRKTWAMGNQVDDLGCIAVRAALSADKPDTGLDALVAAARGVLACGVGNLKQPRYGRRVEAFDRLDDALEPFGAATAVNEAGRG